MSSDDPGVVVCRKRPDDDSVKHNLLRKRIGSEFSDDAARLTWFHFVGTPKPPNPEKLVDLFKKLRPYIPAEPAQDPLYQQPSSANVEQAKTMKRARTVSNSIRGHSSDNFASVEQPRGLHRSLVCLLQLHS
ncbi:TPA: hypothetical protein N0F65_012084 [Lagenidium giganteum]|uniref:Uncharacterized protein n=1 Tax=Lagenidium giganteum TaxID=4803 RepID=A0AAV2YK40_9STRA|nr:TPA: hypothetical protein N0F65_012084 [Lagenidium giganteum]